jgi:DNA-binding transcriptional ArsR family regulator
MRRFTMARDIETSERILDTLKEIRMLLRRITAFSVADNVDAYIEMSDNRRKIIDLCDGENTVTDIARETGIQQPNVSRILTDLKTKGLIMESNQRGRGIYYIKTV